MSRSLKYLLTSTAVILSPFNPAPSWPLPCLVLSRPDLPLSDISPMSLYSLLTSDHCVCVCVCVVSSLWGGYSVMTVVCVCVLFYHCGLPPLTLAVWID